MSEATKGTGTPSLPDTEIISVPFPDEPGPVRMKRSEWLRFQSQLGPACAVYWCERAEDYNNQFPRRWNRYRSHYRTLLNWHQMKVADGYEWFEHPKHGAGYYRQFVIDRALRGDYR